VALPSQAGYQGRIAKSEQTRDKHSEVLADPSTDVRETRTERWGSGAQATHRREGEAGHNVSLVGTMGDTQRSQTISMDNRGIAAQVARNSSKCSDSGTEDRAPLLVGECSLIRIEQLAQAEPDMVFTSLAHRIDLSLLRKSFRQLRKNESSGVDKVTAKQYAKNL
jgi:hypothetical protein